MLTWAKCVQDQGIENLTFVQLTFQMQLELFDLCINKPHDLQKKIIVKMDSMIDIWHISYLWSVSCLTFDTLLLFSCGKTKCTFSSCALPPSIIFYECSCEPIQLYLIRSRRHPCPLVLVREDARTAGRDWISYQIFSGAKHLTPKILKFSRNEFIL